MKVCPRVDIYMKKIFHNTRVLTELCGSYGIQVAGVTKVFCAMPEIAQAMIDGGVKLLADSRIENLKNLMGLPVPKLLLRLPMISQASEVVKYADISLNSELNTIETLNREAITNNKIHKVILMIDLGDLREGLWRGQIIELVEKVINLKGVHLLGIGTNLTCYGGVIPTRENLGRLVDITREVEKKFNINLEMISGGNSSSIYLLEKKQMPSKINNLRLGEAIVLGRETAWGNRIENTYQDAFQLVAEIIELKEKPSVPIGEIGMDAFGNKPIFDDRGLRKRAILAIGRQDVSVQNIIPIDENITILGASSDHLIIDVTDSDKKYGVGDEIIFNIEYGALLQLMTSKYVYKNFIDNPLIF